ncbi:MAG: hypothetical protein JOZ09_17230 [Pseudonocardiales bacterium]|nr:hypothetical protein [Pseudonocardiales bacterium]
MPFGSGVDGGAGQRDRGQQMDQLGRHGGGQHHQWLRWRRHCRWGRWPVVVVG